MPNPDDRGADRNDATGMVPWQYRRRWASTIMLFCMAEIGYSVYSQFETGVTSGFACLAATLSVYIGGAVYDDRGK